MQRLRARLGLWTTPALLLFVGTTTIPRVGLYFHHHSGGDHLHVHADDDHDHDAIDAPHGDAHHHSHLTRIAPTVPEIEIPDGDGTGHWHAQDFFQRATSPTVAPGPHDTSLRPAPAPPAATSVDQPTLVARVRGPPLRA